MKLRSILAIALTAVIGLGVAAVPAVTAEAAAPSSLTVQLLTPSGKKLARSGVEIYVHNAKWYSIAHTNKAGLAKIKYFPATSRLVVETWSKSHKYIEVVKKSVTIKNGKTTKLSLKYAVGASISGKATTKDGKALVKAEVVAYNKASEFVASGTTSSTGAYSIVGLKSGYYHVEFNARDGVVARDNQRLYGWSYWKSAESWGTSNSIKVRQQSSGKTASVIKSISGKVAPRAAVTGEINIPYESSNSTFLDFQDVKHKWSDSPYVKLTDGDASYTQALNPGEYYPGIYDSTTKKELWYTGEGTALTSDPAKAVSVVVDGVTPLTVSLSAWDTAPAPAVKKPAAASSLSIDELLPTAAVAPVVASDPTSRAHAAGLILGWKN